MLFGVSNPHKASPEGAPVRLEQNAYFDEYLHFHAGIWWFLLHWTLNLLYTANRTIQISSRMNFWAPIRLRPGSEEIIEPFNAFEYNRLALPNFDMFSS